MSSGVCARSAATAETGTCSRESASFQAITFQAVVGFGPCGAASSPETTVTPFLRNEVAHKVHHLAIVFTCFKLMCKCKLFGGETNKTHCRCQSFIGIFMQILY